MVEYYTSLSNIIAKTLDQTRNSMFYVFKLTRKILDSQLFVRYNNEYNKLSQKYYPYNAIILFETFLFVFEYE